MEYDHPHEKSSVLGQLFISWVFKKALRGYWYGLKEEDIAKLTIEDRCTTFAPIFESQWRNEANRVKELPENKSDASKTHKQRMETGQGVNVFKLLIKLYGDQYFFIQAIKFALDFIHLLFPLLTGYFLTYLQNKETQPAWKGYASICGFSFLASFHNVIGRKT